jgi:ubiquitin-activating enzyme E1
MLFEKQYNNAIQQLLYNFPKDAVSSTGTPFWSGPKRAPDPLKFDASNPTHFAFIEAATNLHAFNYNINVKGKSKQDYLQALEAVIVPDFSPDANVKIQADDKEPVSVALPLAIFGEKECIPRVMIANAILGPERWRQRIR